jgi:hypothetical protein
MDERQAQQIALGDRPYGVGLLPDKALFEFYDPRNEAATKERWHPILERIGICDHQAEKGCGIVGVRDMISSPTEITFREQLWRIAPMDLTVPHRVPEYVRHRVLAAEAAGIPFAYWIWGKEVSPPKPKLVTQFHQKARTAGAAKSWLRKLDPCLIAIIPTAPNRGIWCSLGEWFEYE